VWCSNDGSTSRREVSVSRVVAVTRAQLAKRRAEVLANLNLGVDELRRARDTRGLTSEEWDALEEIDEIDFLLGDDQ
jgi:hypothetical protein